LEKTNIKDGTSLTPLDSDSIENLFLRFYSYDAINLLVDVLEFLSKRYQQLELHTAKERQLNLKKILILKFEIVAKVCHYIENFGAFAYSISTLRPDRNLVAKAYGILSDYDVAAVDSFYESFVTKSASYNKNLLKLKRIFCYPELTSDHRLSKWLSDTLQNLCDIIMEIGECYIDEKLKIKEAYNSYKHGYRLLFSSDMQNDIDTVVFINKGGSRDIITVDEESVKVYTDLKNKCVLLFKILLYNHRIKQELIKKNLKSNRVKLLFINKILFPDQGRSLPYLLIVIKGSSVMQCKVQDPCHPISMGKNLQQHLQNLIYQVLLPRELLFN
jgi:hypothetical protein